MSPGKQEEKDTHLEKNDSKESNSTITNEPLLNLPPNSVSITGALDPEPPHQLENINPANTTDSTNTDTLQSELKEEEEVQDLASFLIYRACKNSTLANYFYWYLLIECEDQETTVKQDVSNLLFYYFLHLCESV